VGVSGCALGVSIMFKATHVGMEELGVVLTVYRNGRAVVYIEFGNIDIGAHGAIDRRGGFVSLLRVGGCIGEDRAWEGDRLHW
jgi:hypothetical protein